MTLDKIDLFFLNHFKKDKSLTTWIPTTVVYSDKELPSWMGGFCRHKVFSNYIQIATKYKEDEGILRHELTHAKQYGNLFWLHLLLSNFDRYILYIELDAYREQIKAYNYKNQEDYLWIIETLISEKYGINIDYNKVKSCADYMFKDIIEKNKRSVKG